MYLYKYSMILKDQELDLQWIFSLIQIRKKKKKAIFQLSYAN